MEKEIKTLLIIEQCNPEWASVPLVGYNFYEQISKFSNVTLVTHCRNTEALEKIKGTRSIDYIEENPIIKKYYKLASWISNRGGSTNWPLYHLLTYPVYWDFNRKVYYKYKDCVINGAYDIVHAITPMMPRYPVALANACKNTPFILGPVNGGVPFPVGFESTARKESAHFNFLRAIGRNLLPSYRNTYKKARLILSGSTYTLNMLRGLFNIQEPRIRLFYENGVPDHFFFGGAAKEPNPSVVKLLFVGRLVPYKGADMLVEAIAQMPESLRARLHLTIVGDGEERKLIEQQIQAHELVNTVQIVGWVPHEKTRDFYNNSDIFCFPSIREFGGAVVLEAMACGLPCIVVNNGGIGEYVTDATGFRIEPESRLYIVTQLAACIEKLVVDNVQRQTMSSSAKRHAQSFRWDAKGVAIHNIYAEVIRNNKSRPEVNI